MSGPSRHPIVQAWLDGKTDAGGCIADLEAALRKLDSARVGPRHNNPCPTCGGVGSARRKSDQRPRNCQDCKGTGIAMPNAWGVCEGCPPADFPEAPTRCLECPRRPYDGPMPGVYQDGFGKQTVIAGCDCGPDDCKLRPDCRRPKATMSESEGRDFVKEARARFRLDSNVSYPSRVAANDVRRFIHEIADAYERLRILYMATCAVVHRQKADTPSEGPRRGLLELLREARASILSQRYHDTNPLIARIDAALAGTPAEVAPDAKDAARWRAFCSRVYAQKKVSDGGVVAFRFPSFVGGPELLKGSVAQHFTAAVDERWLSRPNPNSACASPVPMQRGPMHSFCGDPECVICGGYSPVHDTDSPVPRP